MGWAFDMHQIGSLNQSYVKVREAKSEIKTAHIKQLRHICERVMQFLPVVMFHQGIANA